MADQIVELQPDHVSKLCQVYNEGTRRWVLPGARTDWTTNVSLWRWAGPGLLRPHTPQI